jgi:hypothetical protein
LVNAGRSEKLRFVRPWRQDLFRSMNDMRREMASFREAVDGLRRAGAQEFLIPGLLTRAELPRCWLFTK